MSLELAKRVRQRVTETVTPRIYDMDPYFSRAPLGERREGLHPRTTLGEGRVGGVAGGEETRG